MNLNFAEIWEVIAVKSNLKWSFWLLIGWIGMNLQAFGQTSTSTTASVCVGTVCTTDSSSSSGNNASSSSVSIGTGTTPTPSVSTGQTTNVCAGSACVNIDGNSVTSCTGSNCVTTNGSSATTATTAPSTTTQTTTSSTLTATDCTLYDATYSLTTNKLTTFVALPIQNSLTGQLTGASKLLQANLWYDNQKALFVLTATPKIVADSIPLKTECPVATLSANGEILQIPRVRIREMVIFFGRKIETDIALYQASLKWIKTEKTPSFSVESAVPLNTTTTPPVVACNYTISPLTKSDVSASGETGNSIAITTDASCSWNATSNANWIVLSSASGKGNAQVGYSIAANTSTTSRTGVVSIAGQNITVTQIGVLPCTYTASPSQVNVVAAGQTNLPANITTTPSNCTWTASSDASWITLGSTTGQGGSTLNYNVASNTTSSVRTGTINLSGQIITVTQAGLPAHALPYLGKNGCNYTLYAANNCTYKIEPAVNAYQGTQQIVNGNGMTIKGNTFQITSACKDMGISIINGTTVTNAGTTYNNVITIQGVPLNLSSFGGAGCPITTNIPTYEDTIPNTTCSYAVSPSQVNANNTASTGSTAITTSSNCAWTASSNVDWITLNTPNGTGSNTALGYSISANTSSVSRTGVISVGGQSVSVTQAASSAAVDNTPLSIRVSGQLNNVTILPTTGVGDNGAQSISDQLQSKTFYLSPGKKAVISVGGQLNKTYISNRIAGDVTYTNSGQLNELIKID